ncbi:MAG TPA: alanine racemase, partial [Rhodobacteraceae bacterium]|nr:alanine racemase [Paracoccaceae bacterium]
MSQACLTIDLDAVAANWRALDALSAQATRTGAVVKADAYGLGAAKVAHRLAKAGAETFFVALAEEGAQVRAAVGAAAEIYVFSGHMDGDAGTLAQHRLTPLLNSAQQLKRHLAALPGHAFGIQLDTGMNRLGMEPNEWQAVRSDALKANPALIMSHLACADEPDHPMNGQQLAAFRELTAGLAVPRSLAATGGILLGRDYHFDLTRPGIGLYGGQPFAEARPVVRLSLPVVQTRDLSPGESVGYSNSWVAPAAARIATVAAGYADGLLRSLSNRATLFADGRPCPVVGRVSMDLITVDVSDLDTIPQTLDILCELQGIDALADAADTIGYEILTSLGRRYR